MHTEREVERASKREREKDRERISLDRYIKDIMVKLISVCSRKRG